MEFALTEEQRMIRDTAEAFLSETSTSASIREVMETEQGFSSELWQRICAEAYWQAILIPEEYSGIGLGFVDLVITLEQMGRSLLCSPFFSTVCLGATSILVAGNEQQKQQYLGQIAAGTTATLAYMGKAANSAWSTDAVDLVANADGDEFELNGSLAYVVDGATAELLVVAARTQGSTGAQGISLFVVPSQTPGLERSWVPTMDQTRRLAEIKLDKVRIPASSLLGDEQQAGAQLEKIINLACIACSAEQVGGAQRLLDMTVEYSKERVQFNRPIASFQVIKHRAAEMMTRTEVARSGLYYAACIADEALNGGDLATELSEAASIAKSYCADACFDNAADAMQIHGGVGFTWEYDVHLFFKRAKAAQHFMGSSEAHRERLAQQLLD